MKKLLLNFQSIFSISGVLTIVQCCRTCMSVDSSTFLSRNHLTMYEHNKSIRRWKVKKYSNKKKSRKMSNKVNFEPFGFHLKVAVMLWLDSSFGVYSIEMWSAFTLAGRYWLVNVSNVIGSESSWYSRFALNVTADTVYVLPDVSPLITKISVSN